MIVLTGIIITSRMGSASVTVDLESLDGNNLYGKCKWGSLMMLCLLAQGSFVCLSLNFPVAMTGQGLGKSRTNR